MKQTGESLPEPVFDPTPLYLPVRMQVFEPASPIPLPLTADVTVRVLDTSGAEVEVALDLASDGSSATFNSPPAFDAPLSPALASVMLEELDACRQLLEFDPDSKCECARGCEHYSLNQSAVTVGRNAFAPLVAGGLAGGWLWQPIQLSLALL